MNLSTSKAGSSSCQCKVTLCEEKKEIKKDVNAIHRQLRNMLVNFLVVIGLSWGFDQKRSGADFFLEDQTDLGTKLRNK